ncbi:MAG: hypothetical protein Q7J84_12595 [Sulfuricaulis sp.]|nr:hypothetical protein [Sulfuricaulis sp.]
MYRKHGLKTLGFRVSPRTLARTKRAAQSRGLSVSELLRLLVKAGLRGAT